ncbi:MAG: hypothetical protein JST08_00335 [Actinobacteria bacterium]|nr:hypothetical protein [Actinomycetota bacterium]
MSDRETGVPRTTLAELVASVLQDFETPVPTGIVRVVASSRSGRKVTAESLSRLAAGQRDAFLRTRRPPLLCHSLGAGGEALTPRIWALADWRAGRRFVTPDSEEGWRALLALGLLREVERPDAADDHLVRTALHATASLLGPAGGYRPDDESGWEELRRQVAQRLPQAGVDSLTREQREAEDRLRDVAAVVAYFGRAVGEGEADRGAAPLVRLPRAGEKGEPFDQVLRRRLGGDPELHSVVVAYLQGFSFVVDEIGRPPSSEEFADFWHFDLPSVRRDEAAFAKAFPEERGPARLVRLLEEGLARRGALRALLDAPVVDPAPPSGEVAPAPGQRWVSPDDSEVLTLIEVEGEQLVGGKHDRRSGTSALWVGSRSEIAEWRLDTPRSVWRVRFDVDVIPATLMEPLAKADIVVDRMMRPANPRPGQSALRVGTVEGQLAAEGEDEARQRVIEAVGALTSLEASEISVSPLPSRLAAER